MSVAAADSATVAEVRSLMITAGMCSGAMRNRRDRPIKNGRWYVACSGTITKVGWGDVAMAEMKALATSLPATAVVILLPETPPGGQHLHFSDRPSSPGDWCWYDREDHDDGPDSSSLAAAATFVITAGQVLVSERVAVPNRLGAAWLSPGYRYTRAGSTIRSSKQRFHVIRIPVIEALISTAATKGARSVNDQHAWWSPAHA
jgi:hypothetical protein